MTSNILKLCLYHLLKIQNYSLESSFFPLRCEGGVKGTRYLGLKVKNVFYLTRHVSVFLLYIFVNLRST